ncbi:hypothetical protein EDD85DRAFT_791936 [Armillaria nabsnona]|nr:hypothetical protein EDD85DRAFT_791936 [Armillaria nabsnona]
MSAEAVMLKWCRMVTTLYSPPRWYMYISPLLNVAVAFRMVSPNLTIHIDVDGIAMLYRLVSIVHYGNSHFTARFIDTDGSVWFNNGIIQVRGAHREGTTGTIDLMQDVSSKTQDHFIYRRA